MRIFDLWELAREKQEALDKSSREEEEIGHESGEQGLLTQNTV